MGDFFKPWRRKIGVVTLMLACVLTAGWLRSFLVNDYLNVWAGRDSEPAFHYYRLWSVVSAHGSLFCGRIWGGSEDVKVVDQSELYYRYPRWAVDKVPDPDFPSSDVVYIWRFGDFAMYVREWGDTHNGGLRLVIPYWSFVIPLTLLSAWLLISKPRTTKRSPASKQDSVSSNVALSLRREDS